VAVSESGKAPRLAPAPVPTAAERLAEIDAAGLLRRMRTLESMQGPRVELDGREVLMLCSNDYLGLAGHPDVRLAGAQACERWGAGAGSSRLVAGNMGPHASLERRLAAFHGSERALLFGSGYLANTGTIAALARRGTVVYSDELNHASIVDGCRLAGAAKFVYRHADSEQLAWALERSAAPAALIVTDGLFSMDGDSAPLEPLVRLARDHGALLMVDEAHAFGAAGPGGRGTAAAAGLAGEVDVLVGTLGKSLGSYGAYACVSAELRELLVNTARPLIFSTGLPPASAAAAEAALGLLEAEPALVEQLQANAALIRSALAAAGVEAGPGSSQIVPVRLGDPERALAACAAALERGVYAQAIRPPTVPEGTSRLRLTVMAGHEPSEMRSAAAVLADALRVADEAAAGPPAAPEPAPGELRVIDARAGEASGAAERPHPPLAGDRR
jgi:8-amino-7-oxononanoate synthase